MRIRFAVPSSPEATALRELGTRAEAFFAFAVQRIGSASLPADRRVVERDLAAALREVSQGLVVEIDVEAARVRAVLSPSHDAGLEPLVGQILRRAPSTGNVEFVRHRCESDVAPALADVRDRFGVDLSDARLRIGFSRGHLLEAVVHSSAVSSAADGPALDAANFLVLRLLGDELFDDWVGAVEVAPAPRQSPLKLLSAPKPTVNALALDETLPAVEAAIRGLYAELPDAPYRVISDQAKWTLLEAEPGAELDYPAQDDIALKSTVMPEAMKCFLERGPFASKRFSRHGESFAYVKIDAIDETAHARHELRVRLEDVLGKALMTSGVGCVVGAGLGVRYLYIDVALENVERGVSLVREALRGLDVDLRSWILFCDAALSREWVGVWEESPPPPER